MIDHSVKDRVQLSIKVLQIVVLAVLLIITARLFQLQIVDYDKYGPLSQQNTILQEYVSPARGLIYDNTGQLLVDNEPTYTITVTPANFRSENIPLLAELSGFSEEEVQQRLLVARNYSWHRPSRMFTEIDFETFAAIQENLWQLPGVGHQVDSKRHYPTDIRASHLLGYLREISEQQYHRSDRYRLGDKAGRSGLEQIYENQLRGETGTTYLRVNALGQTVGLYDDGSHDVAPTKGADIHTTINSELQILAEELMEGKTGGLVAMDPRNGDVLSMVSSPQFEVDKLSGKIDRDYWQSINADSTRPMFNRAISTMQPPGSTVKPMMGLVGKELELIDRDKTVYCDGGFTRGRRYHCLDDHGHQNLEQAITNSCNTYFFSLMNDIINEYDIDTWHRLTSELGFGQPTGIDLPSETPGILPDSSYYNRIWGNNGWGPGDLMNLGIGQGSFSVSPLQMAYHTSMLANGGTFFKPRLVDRVVFADGTHHRFESEQRSIDWVSQEHFETLKRGMIGAVTEGSGRYYLEHINGVEAAGKTGTSQNPHGLNHGWFITYAPLDDPEIVIAIMLENSGYGSISAAPIAVLMLEQYFNNETTHWIKDYVLNFDPSEDDDLEEEDEEDVIEEVINE